MNYLTRYFTPRRVVPARRLAVPVSQVLREPRNGPLPIVVNGHIYNAEVDREVFRRNESDFARSQVWRCDQLWAGVFCADGSSFLVREGSGRTDAVTPETPQVTALPSTLALDFSDDSLATEARYYSVDQDCNLVSVDRNSLTTLWQFSPPGIIARFAVSPDGRVAVHDPEANLFCLDDHDGSMLWHKTPDDWKLFRPGEWRSHATQSYPHIFEDKVIVASEGGFLVAVSLATGDLVWQQRFEAGVGSPCVHENGLIYFLYSSHLGIVDARTGAVRRYGKVESPSTLPAEVSLDATVFVDATDTHVWCTTHQGLVAAIDIQTGLVEWWDYDADMIQGETPIIICNNRLYMLSMNWFYVYEGVGGLRAD